MSAKAQVMTSYLRNSSDVNNFFATIVQKSVPFRMVLYHFSRSL